MAAAHHAPEPYGEQPPPIEARSRYSRCLACGRARPGIRPRTELRVPLHLFTRQLGCISIGCGRDGRKLTGLPNHARSRRSCPLHRWLVDHAAAAELPTRSSLPVWRDARRAPAVLMPRRSHDLDLPGVRRRGVRTAATCRLPCCRRPGRGALGTRRATPFLRFVGHNALHFRNGIVRLDSHTPTLAISGDVVGGEPQQTAVGEVAPG
jgi:hypothetical protein